MHCNIPLPDLPARLDQTICLYKDEPYFVRTGDGDAIILYDMVDRRTSKHIIRSSDPDFDIATPPLGYVQVTKNAIVYTSRRPSRQFKQGIIGQSLYITNVKGGRSGADHFNFYGAGFRDCMARKYSPLSELLNTLRECKEEEHCELAVSNDCALVLTTSGITKVLFREEEVGIISKTDLLKKRPVVRVPNTKMGWIVEKYLSELDFEIRGA